MCNHPQHHYSYSDFIFLRRAHARCRQAYTQQGSHIHQSIFPDDSKHPLYDEEAPLRYLPAEKQVEQGLDDL
jgi:hypothetical protein